MPGSSSARPESSSSRPGVHRQVQPPPNPRSDRSGSPGRIRPRSGLTVGACPYHADCPSGTRVSWDRVRLWRARRSRAAVAPSDAGGDAGDGQRQPGSDHRLPCRFTADDVAGASATTHRGTGHHVPIGPGRRAEQPDQERRWAQELGGRSASLSPSRITLNLEGNAGRFESSSPRVCHDVQGSDELRRLCTEWQQQFSCVPATGIACRLA